MAVYCSINMIYFFLTLFIGVSSETYIDDFKDTTIPVYIKMNMDKDTICDPLAPVTIGKKTYALKSVDLQKFKNVALIVYPGHTLDSWHNVNHNKNCKFKVKASKGDGLFAVIQSMHLRSEGSECLDYIRFTPENGNSSKKFCGQYERLPVSDSNLLDTDHSFPNFFEELSKDGKIITEIFISKKALNPGQSLNLTITYTPFRGCSDNEIEKYPKIFSQLHKFCISPNYICDSNINCVSSMCNDEEISYCGHDQLSTLNGYKTLTLTAVTSTFLCFVIFLMCLYICRRHEKLCWSSDCAGPSDNSTGNGLPMDRSEQSGGNRPYVPTAPMLEVAVSSVNDKDLPPSYDSLFPTQSSTANT